jgi:molybdopterin-containing oxidoreductase family membrane subunit
MIRDRAKKPFQKHIYSILSFGWSGKMKDWQRFEEVSLVLAGLATPLVLSVHTIVSFDFATSVVPGWHSTIFPPYFVAGAIFSGFAMVQTLLIIMRKVSNLENYITVNHIELMNKVILVTGGIVGVAYISEFFIAWYTGSPYENYTYLSFGAATGPYWWAFWALILCNMLVPLTLWVKKFRRNIIWTFIVSIIINIGMWFERFDIIVLDLSKGRTPSSWAMFSPTFVDVGIFVGTLGFFFVLFLLYARSFPVIAQAEVKSILKLSGDKYKKMREQYGDDVQLYTLPEQQPLPDFKKLVEELEEKNEEIRDEQGELIESLLTKIGQASNDNADDLKRLSGVGPVLEEKLNQLGVYKYQQILKMSDREFNILNRLIDAFPKSKSKFWSGEANILNQI